VQWIFSPTMMYWPFMVFSPEIMMRDRRASGNRALVRFSGQ